MKVKIHLFHFNLYFYNFKIFLFTLSTSNIFSSILSEMCRIPWKYFESINSHPHSQYINTINQSSESKSSFWPITHILEADSASTKAIYVTHHCQKRMKSRAWFHLPLIKFILKIYVVKIWKTAGKANKLWYSHSLRMNLSVCVHQLSRWFVAEKVTDVSIGWRFSLGRYSLLKLLPNLIH